MAEFGASWWDGGIRCVLVQAKGAVKLYKGFQDKAIEEVMPLVSLLK